MVVATDGRIVDEADLRPDEFCVSAQSWKLPACPPPHLLRVLFPSAEVGSLGSQAKLPQQPAHRPKAQINPEFIGNHFGHHLTGPERKGKIQLQRVLVRDQVENKFQFLCGKLLGSAAPSFRLQSTPSTASVSRQPRNTLVVKTCISRATSVGGMPDCTQLTARRRNSSCCDGVSRLQSLGDMRQFLAQPNIFAPVSN